MRPGGHHPDHPTVGATFAASSHIDPKLDAMTAEHSRDAVDAPDVRVQTRGAVRELRLDRPQTLNAWTPDLGRELLGLLRDAAADPAVRAIVISGEGRAFSAGADVTVPRELTAEGHSDLQSRLEQIYNPIVETVRAAPKPVIASVQGAVAGLGASLALACDFIIAAESAYFLLAFVHLGVAPDAGILPNLARRIGPARATRLAMLGERLSAHDAESWGLVSELVPDAERETTTAALADRLAAGPTVALDSIKQILAAADHLPLHEVLAFEARIQQRHATTTDYTEGVTAFREKRKPNFLGG